jgi:uncharacterized protein YndB with AHSA1/START domain
MNRLFPMVALALLTIGQPAVAEVLSSGVAGFSISNTAEIAASPEVVYRTMTSHIDQWWNGSHSWSGDASNLYLEPELGSCFCERLPAGGQVEHLRIIYLSPGKEVRFDGALGPLQQMAVDGRMIWKIEPAESGSKVSFTYHVHGYAEGGFEQLAPAVDAVIGEQLSHLAARHSTAGG